ncbi:efflux transporter outer membrane subunit [Anaeromyxobacter oryzisoli]|uniref:efflux transporter outer membrane subunit n=1 Tax=Anaeromyxobacter oryzisoli TaxID=2925408 RepID=UPI001F56B27F|nr:efflux transporter outer membrane subunit [Anaeromyxobacter sp. SG63]
MDYSETRARGAPAVAALSLVVLGAAGCASPGRIAPREHLADTAALAPGHEIAEAELAGRWPDADWWLSFGDPQLDALVAEALGHAPRLAVASARIRQAQAFADGARAGLLPSVDAGAAAMRVHPSDFQTPKATEWQNQARLGLSYELDLWGRHRNALEGALDGVQVAAYEARSARLALVGAIVRTYAELALQLDLQDSARSVLEDQQKSLEVARRRMAAGIGTELPVRQAETQIATTRSELAQLDGRAALLRHQLGALVGAGPGAGDPLRRPALRLDPSVAVPSRLPAELLGRRPDVLASRWRVERAAREIDVARAAFLPNVDLAAFAGVFAFGFTKLFTPDAVGWGAGPAISLPIFEGGRLRAGLEGRTAEYDAAVSDYQATLVDALTDVADQLARLGSLRREQAEREVALASAERAHALALQAYQAGFGDYLDTLVTEIALRGERDQLVRLRYAQLEAGAALTEALGGGVVPEAAAYAADAAPVRVAAEAKP